MAVSKVANENFATFDAILNQKTCAFAMIKNQVNFRKFAFSQNETF